MTEQTNITPEDEQRLARLPPELQQVYRQALELTAAYERCRQLEEASRVKLPPDTNRWRISAPPPPTSTPEVNSPQRPSGWAKFDAIGPPPGVDICDRLMDTQDAKDRLEREREYRQYFLDAHWEVKLADEQRRRAQAEQTCHRGPGDADWDIK